MSAPPRRPAAMDRPVPPAAEDVWGDPGPARDLAAALDEAHVFAVRHVAFPSTHAAVATVLWCAHCHVVDVFDSTARLAFLSPEPASGKSRALEVAGTLVPHPMHAVNCTPAALFRSVADLAARPTILFDEIDTIFGPKAKDNEEIRGFLNAGHRRSGVAYRCVGLGTNQKVMPFPAFCAVAVAGLNDVPDTIATRAVIIRMRRRAPHEKVAPFRPKVHEPIGNAIRDTLAAALAGVELDPDPDMPEGVCDRPADVWEPLLSIAQAAGDRWAALGEAACRHFTLDTTGREPSLSVRLLADLFDIFTAHGHPEHLATAVLVEKLRGIDEGPWADLRGKPLDARGLSRMLGRYEVRPGTIRQGSGTPRGYGRADLWDAWVRYLPAERLKSATSETSATGSGNHALTCDDAQPRQADPSATSATSSATSATLWDPPATTPAAHNRRSEADSVGGVAGVADVADFRRQTHEAPTCSVCGLRLDPMWWADGQHPDCEVIA